MYLFLFKIFLTARGFMFTYSAICVPLQGLLLLITRQTANSQFSRSYFSRRTRGSAVLWHLMHLFSHPNTKHVKQFVEYFKCLVKDDLRKPQLINYIFLHSIHSNNILIFKFFPNNSLLLRGCSMSEFKLAYICFYSIVVGYMTVNSCCRLN